MNTLLGQRIREQRKEKAGQLNSLPNESICRQIMLETWSAELKYLNWKHLSESLRC